MSNKTQLQTNNTKYASLIETLRSKASGGSGGGAGVETCALKLYTEGIPDGSDIIYYIDESLTLQEISFPPFNEVSSVTVIKNSIIYGEYIPLHVSGNIIRIDNGDNSNHAFFISGDAYITYV